MVRIIMDLESMAQKVEKLLHTSGGALELSKCFYYIMKWKWIKGEPFMCSGTDFEGTSIHLTKGEDAQKYTINRKEVTTPHRTLGVYVAPDGSFTKQLDILKQKDEDFATNLQKSKLAPHLAKMAYEMQHHASMGYVLPVTTLETTELHVAQQKTTSAILQQYGKTKTTHKPWPLFQNR